MMNEVRRVCIAAAIATVAAGTALAQSAGTPTIRPAPAFSAA
jgi:hypothetical protein